MLHYTLNSANTFDCSTKRYNSSVFKLLKPLVTRAIAEGSTESSLPHPFESYRVKISVNLVGAALFDLFDPEGVLMVTNSVAWTEEGQEAVWEFFERLYLRLGQFGTLSVSRAPICPESLPWLTTLILPNSRVIDWVADFEQCLALTIIREAQAKEKGGKGFGK